jgi:hypothetical protein
MSTLECTRQALRETAALLDAEELVERRKGRTWALVLQGGQSFRIEHDAVEETVLLVAKIGGSSQVPDATTCEMLLRYNASPIETGGLRMAIEGQPGSVVLVLQLAAYGLNPPGLLTVINQMADTCAAWRELIAPEPLAIEFADA